MVKLAFLQQPFPQNSYEPIVPINGTHLLWKEKKMLHFLGQDALGLCQQNDLKKSAMKYLLQFGAGASVFKHPRECLPCQHELQDKLAGMLGVEQTLFLPSRCTALTILLSQLVRPSSLVFVDEGCHPQTLELLQACKTQLIFYKHNDLVHLAELIQATSQLDAFSKLIFTESLFSTSGDTAPLERIAFIAQKSQALLIVDDSLSFGMKGDDGLGLAAQTKGIDCIVTSLLPSCGIPAAFVGCGRELADHLMNSYPFWQDHAVCIPTLGTIDAALEWIPQMNGERRQLEHRCHWLLLQLNKLEFPIHPSQGNVITLNYEGENEAALLWQSLVEQEILCEMITGSCNKLRITINTLHTPEDLNRLYQALQRELQNSFAR